MGRPALTAIVVAMVVLHQDFWFWTSPRPLLFGFLPPGLWYHLFYSLAASVTLALLVKYAWPADSGDDQPGGETRR